MTMVVMIVTTIIIRGSRAKRRPTTNIRETDLEIEKGLAGLSQYVTLLTSWTSVQVSFNF